MARFYIRAKPAPRKEVTRLAHATGARVSLEGWDSGVLVHARVDASGRDVFDIFATAGSNGDRDELIATVSGPNGLVAFYRKAD